METTPSQQTRGSSPVVDAAAWLFILMVTVPMGCGVLFLGAFGVILAASQVPGWLAKGLLLVFGFLVTVVLVLALSRIVRGARAKRRM